jgi:hypothetical protein
MFLLFVYVIFCLYFLNSLRSNSFMFGRRVQKSHEKINWLGHNNREFCSDEFWTRQNIVVQYISLRKTSFLCGECEVHVQYMLSYTIAINYTEN